MQINEEIINLNANPKPASADPLANDGLPRYKSKHAATAPGSGREHDVIMVYMDGLFDTVMGTVAGMDEKLAVKLMKSNRYRNRLLDKFAHITAKDFKEAFAKRDLETLKRCGVTNVVHFMQRLIKDAMVHSAGVSLEQELTFMVNVWPYDIDDELAEMVATCVRFHTFNTSRVDIVSISDADLKPDYVRNELDIIIRTNYWDWLYMHREDFEKNLCPHVGLVVPSIFQHELPDAEANATCVRLGKSPFEIAEELHAPVIRMKFMPTSLFCLTDSVNGENAAQTAFRLEVQPEDLLAVAEKKGMKVVEEPLMPNHDLNTGLVGEEAL